MAGIGSQGASAATEIDAGDANPAEGSSAPIEHMAHKRMGQRERIYFRGLLAANSAQSTKRVSLAEVILGKIINLETIVIARAEFALQVRQIPAPAREVKAWPPHELAVIIQRPANFLQLANGFAAKVIAAERDALTTQEF